MAAHKEAEANKGVSRQIKLSKRGRAEGRPSNPVRTAAVATGKGHGISERLERAVTKAEGRVPVPRPPKPDPKLQKHKHRTSDERALDRAKDQAEGLSNAIRELAASFTTPESVERMIPFLDFDIPKEEVQAIIDALKLILPHLKSEAEMDAEMRAEMGKAFREKLGEIEVPSEPHAGHE